MKQKNTKRALLLSALSLLMCVSMLIGSTFAWFTDSVTSGGNIIKAGALDVEMYWAKGTEAPESANWIDASTGAIFDYDLWEPGYVEVRHVKIENKGNLALKYKLNLIPNGEVSILGDVIDVYFADPAIQVETRETLNGKEPIGSLTDVIGEMDASTNGNLEAGESVIVTIALKMRESAGNDYQGISLGTDFAVKLYATQHASESDSFGKDYDEGISQITSVENWLANITELDDVVLEEDIKLDDELIRYDGTTSTVNLNEHKVESSYNGPVFYATNGADLTIDGEGRVVTDNANGYSSPVWTTSNSTVTVNGGTFDMGETKQKYHLYSQNSSTIVINDGTFISNDESAALVYCINGFVEINGGFFQNTANPNAALISMGNNIKYINNQKVTLRGGTFVNWNPMDSAFARPWTNPDVPALIVLADGYQMISETQTNGDIWYMVVAK